MLYLCAKQPLVGSAVQISASTMGRHSLNTTRTQSHNNRGLCTWKNLIELASILNVGVANSVKIAPEPLHRQYFRQSRVKLSAIPCTSRSHQMYALYLIKFIVRVLCVFRIPNGSSSNVFWILHMRFRIMRSLRRSVCSSRTVRQVHIYGMYSDGAAIITAGGIRDEYGTSTKSGRRQRFRVRNILLTFANRISLCERISWGSRNAFEQHMWHVFRIEIAAGMFTHAVRARNSANGRIYLALASGDRRNFLFCFCFCNVNNCGWIYLQCIRNDSHSELLPYPD